MSVDIEEMAAHLERGRLKDVKEQYEARATNATATFLLCFFLGYLGAHRFYLGQWRSGLARLALFILGATSIVAGFLTSAPLNAALYVIGGVLVLASLIWEIIDLGRIDREIHQRNTLLAEGLIAGALLSDPAPLEAAASKLDDAIHTAAAQSLAAGAEPAASVASIGTITADDLAQARALAEESGRASISYHEISNYTVSATPEERAGVEPTPAPATEIERHVITEQAPASQESSPVVEETTYVHRDEGYHVTESEEMDRVTGPSAADVVGLSAAQLGYMAAQAAPAHEAPTIEPVTEAAHEPATSPLAEPAVAHAHETLSAEPHVEAPAATVAETPIEALDEAPTAPATPAPEPSRAERDVTDAWAPASIAPAADVAFASSYPGYIALPEEPAPAPIEPIFASDAYSTPVSAPTEPDMPVYIAPEEPETMGAPPAAEPPAESYTPPVPDVYSASAPRPEAYRPSWEEPTAPASPTLVEPAQEPRTLAELAEAGTVASGGARAAEALTHQPTGSAPEPAANEAPAAEPATPKMKRIRVKHRIVVEGQVVREETVEREVPADMDMAVAVRQIQAELEQTAAATPDEIARMANLSADDEVEVRRHVEGPGQ